MNASKLLVKDEEILNLYKQGFSVQAVARLLNLYSSSVEYRLKVNGVSMRSRSEACKGPKSESHKKNLRENRLGRFTGSENPNWKGGKETERMKKVSALKRSPQYKSWRKEVISTGYCVSCGSTDRLEGHHILPKSKFPHLVFSVQNGLCLCHSCHKRFHSEGVKVQGGELLESPERIISSQAKEGIPLKVQRLEGESRTDSNPSMSAVPVREDIV